MSFLKKLFSSGKLDGLALARSDQRADLAQIHLLSCFETPRPRHDEREQRQWERALPRGYAQQIDLMVKQGWLQESGDTLTATPTAGPFLAIHQERMGGERERVMAQVRQALQGRDTSEALEIRRRYEANHPLGKAEWTGPDPQLSHSALTRRILFLNHWLVEDLDETAQKWLKLYAAEQHLWGTEWQLSPDEVPEGLRPVFARPGVTPEEGAYWRSRQLALYVENQETWQRCKGGDHVRRIEIQGPDDAHTCEHCRPFLGEQYLVIRVPELPHRACTSLRGCRCEYVPVLDTYMDLEDEG